MTRKKQRGPTKKTIFRFDRKSKRLWLFGQRIHHGAVGAIMAAIGAVLAAHDVRDIFKWFKGGEQND